MRAINNTRHANVAECVDVADTGFRRMKGLLGRKELPRGHGLLITPCGSIHTAFMRFPIDVIFLDRDGTVLKIRERLPPWRFAACPGARATLELAGGTLADAARVGETISIR
ncbi:MAG: DUF192 domain-containing protein [Planctomycetota bacterium]